MAPLVFRAPHVLSCGLGCLWPHGCCGRRRARPPARLGGLTSFGAAPRSPARPRRRPPALRQVPPAPPHRRRLVCCALHRLARLPAAQQFRMQFSSSKVLVRVSMHCYVTCVFELHATFAWASPSPGNFARNSPGGTSNRELASLQLQRLWTVSKSDRRKLCASFAWLAPAATRRHGNFACNSLLGISNFEFVSLELQRFWALLKVHAIELHAKFGERHVAGLRWGVGWLRWGVGA